MHAFIGPMLKLKCQIIGYQVQLSHSGADASEGLRSIACPVLRPFFRGSEIDSMSCPSPIPLKTVMSQLRASRLNYNLLQLSDFDPTSSPVRSPSWNPNSMGPYNLNKFSVNCLSKTPIGQTLLNEDNLRKRTRILEFLIKLGAKLLEMQNYNALILVMIALNSFTILRLKRT
ncbi:hypothetical protein MJO28_006984 [Puccinia striiformis f. sp. tritici]|uniref:Ras-GEF domain-containing protein n=2 Tax=Puccinia striiformis TaxID=27350 RepID=A0A2S4VWD5_9BASI|nr:hypothetical protein MJO28_006984 [Puccinia striiformis f. sp. tritici]POW13844.1 hypothetical protein PSTT_03509 [Puccinia striiformis]